MNLLTLLLWRDQRQRKSCSISLYRFPSALEQPHDELKFGKSADAIKAQVVFNEPKIGHELESRFEAF